MSGLLETLQKVCSNAGSVKNCSVVLVLFFFFFYLHFLLHSAEGEKVTLGEGRFF